MEQFEILDITGDAGIRAIGPDLSNLFRNATIGMYSLITDIESIQEEKNLEISVSSNSIEGLFIAWLNELIFQFDAYGFIGKKILITEFITASEQNKDIGFSLKAILSGDEFDPEKHEQRLLIKAATYHKLKIEEKDDGWQAEVIFDI